MTTTPTRDRQFIMADEPVYQRSDMGGRCITTDPGTCDVIQDRLHVSHPIAMTEVRFVFVIPEVFAYAFYGEAMVPSRMVVA